MAAAGARNSQGSSPALLSYGFRPFFLLAGLWAVVPVAVLTGALAFGLWPSETLTPFRWHGHEMIFGFAAAAIAGFLLTAVPNWTGTRPLSGYALAALVLLWLAGRVASAPFAATTGWLGGLAAIAFFPALAVAVAVPIVRARNLRNLPFGVFLALLFLAELLYQGERLAWFAAPAFDPLRLGVNMIALMVTIVGGRIVPAFTRNKLRSIGRDAHVKTRAWIDAAAIAAVATVVVGDVVAPGSTGAGALAAVAALLLMIRMSGWRGERTLDTPLLWVLHLAWLWLVAGFALKALWLLGGFAWAANWMHALTAGAFGTMILGVTTRAALGHTGRALEAARPIVAAYLLVTLAGILRVGGPWLAPALYGDVLVASAALWVAAFVVFVIVYAPILLLAPRRDG